MAIDRNTRPDIHEFRLSRRDMDVLAEALPDDAVLNVAWHRLHHERRISEAERMAIWRLIGNSHLGLAFRDYRLDWDRIAPAVERVKGYELVPDEFWILGKARYKVPGGEFYDRGHYDVHHQNRTAEVHQALYDEFVEDGLAEWEQRGGRRFLYWHRTMWVHDDPRRVKPRQTTLIGA